MASMKKVMFGALFFFIAFELISCIPLLDDAVFQEPPKPDLSPYFSCIGEKQSSCMPKGKFSTSHAVFQFLLFSFRLSILSVS